MYLSATIAIDPRQLTQIRRKPTKGFRRFAEILTANMLSQQEEHETFTAISIMQEINIVLRSMGILDVVKFSRDGIVIYEDGEGRDQEDLEHAIEQLGSKAQSGEGFRELRMLLEHHLPNLAMVMELAVSRVHEVGVYPLRLEINALDPGLQAESEELHQRLDSIFESQSAYDSHRTKLEIEFERFLSQLEESIRSKMQVEQMHVRRFTDIVRPGLSVLPPATKNSVPNRDSRVESGGVESYATEGAPPILQRYGHDNNHFGYIWLWAYYMNQNNIYVQQSRIVSEEGTPVVSIGEQGFHSAESPTLDATSEFALPDCEYSEVNHQLLRSKAAGGGDGGSSGSAEVSSEADFQDEGHGTKSSSWLDFFSFGDSHGATHDTAHDGSSCSGDAGGDGGGSSCGGGCGGGD